MNAEEIRNQDFDHKHCQAGCKVFSYGEIKHHQDCVYYEDSLSQSYDEKSIRIKQLEEERDQLRSQILDQTNPELNMYCKKCGRNISECNPPYDTCVHVFSGKSALKSEQ
jgi:hypothetical protein